MSPILSLHPASRQPVTRGSNIGEAQGDKWFLDEVFLKINGVQHYLWRAVDQNGAMIDILVQSKRDRFAAMRFFRRLLETSRCRPRVIITDKLRSYGAAKKVILPRVTHRQKPVLKQSSREFTSADATTRAPYETLQVAGACATFSGDTRYCVCPLSTETTSAPCRMLPSGKAAPISDMEADHRCLTSFGIAFRIGTLGVSTAPGRYSVFPAAM